MKNYTDEQVEWLTKQLEHRDDITMRSLCSLFNDIFPDNKKKFETFRKNINAEFGNAGKRGRKYTNEQLSFLKSIWYGNSESYILKEYNNRFPDNANSRGIISIGYHEFGPRDTRFHFSEEENNWLRENGPYYSTKDLAIMLYDIFGRKISTKSVDKKLSDLNIEKTKETRFRVRSEWQSREIGYTYFDKGYGCWMIKVNNGSRNANGYMRLHHYIYEQKYGKLNPGDTVLFRDGDPNNCDISNLVKVDRYEKAFMSFNKMIGKSTDITDAAIALAKLNKAIRDRTTDDI